ncbi:hypothetical protein Tco_1123149 [Tanacetum coccineum]|uniref:Uncharacterized protein n=1 Tax=Tanacetum coccineum TaxID=301880 RepID=A0ABQ5J698_9ASTR
MSKVPRLDSGVRASVVVGCVDNELLGLSLSSLLSYWRCDVTSSTPHALSLTLFGLVTGDRLSWSDTRLCTDCVPCGTAQLMLFAPVYKLCSLRNGGAWKKWAPSLNYPLATDS